MNLKYVAYYYNLRHQFQTPEELDKQITARYLKGLNAAEFICVYDNKIGKLYILQLPQLPKVPKIEKMVSIRALK